MYLSGLLTIPGEPSFWLYEQRKLDTQFEQSFGIKAEMVIYFFPQTKEQGFGYKHFSIKQLCR